MAKKFTSIFECLLHWGAVLLIISLPLHSIPTALADVEIVGETASATDDTGTGTIDQSISDTENRDDTPTPETPLTESQTDAAADNPEAESPADGVANNSESSSPALAETATTTTTSEATTTATTTKAAAEDFSVTTSGSTTTATTSATVDETLASSTRNDDNNATTTTVTTGDAVSTVNLVNILNTNFVNSDGNMVLLDMYVANSNTVDLRSAAHDGSCSLTSCAGDALSVTVADNASIDNAVVLMADTGNNTIRNATGAAITTGNAYSNANIINLANSNIINSQYLLAIINAFGDFSGDIVFPSLSSFFNSVVAPMPVSTALYNDATVVNDVELAATSGDNAITGTGSSTTTTGDATTAMNTVNNVNTSLLGGQSIVIMFRVVGAWSGQVFGLPTGASFLPTAYGYLLELPGTAGSSTVTDGIALAGSSTAAIHNRVSAESSTGNNHIENANTALIATGNAYAGANIVNIANAHVVGRNWMLALVNIFGDFTGNVSFGRPDLFVGGKALIADKARSGDTVHYTYTVMNNGDSGANNITVTDTTSTYVTPKVGSYTIDPNARTITWKIPHLNPGESTTVQYEGILTDIKDVTEIKNTVVATARETDNNVADNTETMSFFAGSRSHHNSSQSSGRTRTTDTTIEYGKLSASLLQNIKITRTPEVSYLSPTNNTVNQKIVLFNDSSSTIPAVTLKDMLPDSIGKTLLDETWVLGDILPHEEITLSYTLTLSNKTSFGTYTFQPTLTAPYGTYTVVDNGTLIYGDLLTFEAPSAFHATTPPTTPLPTGLVAGSATTTSTATEPDDNSFNLINTAEAAENFNGSATNSSTAPLLAKLAISFMLSVLSMLFYRIYRQLPKVVAVENPIL